MTFIPGKSCAEKLPLLQLVVSIMQAVPGESRCCGTENWGAMTIFLGFQYTFYWRVAVNSVKHDWSYSFPRVLSCEPMCPSTGLFLLFWFSFPPTEIAKATSLLSSQAQYVLSHAVSVGYGVCVGVCTYVYMYISCSRPVMLLFGGKATSTIKVGSKTACGFLKCWVGVGSLGKTPKETLNLLCTYRYMYLNALHRP